MSDCKHEAALREASRLLVLDDPHNPTAYDWARVLDAAADHIAEQRAEIARLTRERDEVRALVQHAYLTAWAARHNRFKATPPDMRKGWRAFALAQGLPLGAPPADAAEAPE